MSNTNIHRVPLTPELAAKIDELDDQNEAFALLDIANEFEQREHRPMTLQDALVAIGKVSQDIEAMG